MLAFYSTDTARISDSNYTGEANGVQHNLQGYWPGGWCGSGGQSGKVGCSDAGYITWRDFEGRDDNPLGPNASSSYCHYKWNMNAST